MRYVVKANLRRMVQALTAMINVIILICSVVGIILCGYLVGFDVEQFYIPTISRYLSILLVLFFVLISLRSVIGRLDKKKNIAPYRPPMWIMTFLFIAILVEIDMRYYPIFDIPSKAGMIYIACAIFLTSILELSKMAIRIMTRVVNPMAVFVISFLIIIAIGTVLLSVPNSTYEEGSNLPFVDALFVSTSATCVTGLCTVDFMNTFTLYGQIVVLVLIQIGGLGVVTLTSFFALSLIGALPFNSSMMLKDLISEDSTTNIRGVVIRIVTTTFTLEAIGAAAIFFSLGNYPIASFWDKIYFSVFHAISAFCNAGFSNYPDGLGSPTLTGNNTLYYVISLLVIMGGIGFPVFTNFFKIIAIRCSQFIRRLEKKRVKRYLHSWGLNSMIVIKITLLLLIFGTAYFLIFEWNGMLSGYSVWGKIAQAFYNAVLPRTAGFGSQDISSVKPLTYIVIVLLMWIGGAPQSTAGGIKVTTIWIMFKNAYCQVRGLNHVETHKREISAFSVNRAFATVTITVGMIFVSYVALMFTEAGVEPRKLLFEVVSAISTVGSSMGITADLSVAGKYIITFIMFAGRIGVITLVSSFLSHKDLPQYRYPSEHVLM